MGIERIKKYIKAVPDGYKQMSSHDKNDYWLVQEILFDDRDYEKATHVLIGCPQHEGIQRNNGRIGAAEAPNKIREQLYKLQVEANSVIKLFDAGNVITDYYDNADESDLSLNSDKSDALVKIHDALTKAVSEFLRDGKKVIVLGGGNDISYADLRALSETEREISAINIDAHLDMRKADKMTSGTPYRKALDDHFLSPQHFHEFGIRPESNATFYMESATEMGVKIHYLENIIEKGVVRSFGEILNQINGRPLFLGLDMDSIRSADAPGVSASSPMGLSGREVMQCIHHAKLIENLKLFEITEVNPTYDIDNRTVKLAAQLVYGILFGQ